MSDGLHRPMRRAGTVFCALAFFLVTPASFADDSADYLRNARKLESAHDLRGASIELRNAAQAAPANGAIRLELARVYLALGNANAAEAELFAAHLRGIKDEDTAPLMAQAMLDLGAFADLLKNVPAGSRPPRAESVVRSYRGVAELSLGETDKARAMFADAERLDPKSVLPLIGETRLLLQLHQVDAADKKADQVLKLDPHNPDALDAKGLILAVKGQSDAALRQFGVILAANPNDLRALVDRANVFIQRHNPDAAEKDLATIRKLAPQNAMAAYFQAVIDAQRGKFKDADALIDKLRGAMTSFPQAYVLAAEVKFKLNQFDQAEGFARRAVAQAGEKAGAYQILGAIALKRGDTAAAVAALEKTVQLAPDDANAAAALGEAYIAHGDLDKANAAFNRAALKAPGSVPIATQKALTEFAAGDRQKSVAALNDIFKGGKGSIVAGPPLVLEALQTGQLDLAEATARQLVAHDGGNLVYQELLAGVRMAQHDYRDAETVLRGVLAKQPNLFSARHDLAQVYLLTNRPADARKLYEERLRGMPKDEGSLKALAEIAFATKSDAEAIALLNRAQDAVPSDPEPSLRILSMLEARKKWPDALRVAHTLQGRFGGDAGVQDAVARLYFVSGNSAAAIAAYKAAVARFPKNALLYAHYSGILAAGKNYAAAVQMAQRACELEPHSPELKRALVTLTYLASGENAALATAQSVSGDATGTTAALLTAEIMYANNNRSGALALLEKRQAQNPSSVLLVRLAGMYQRAGQIDRASALLQSWTAAHPADADARFVLAQLESTTGKFDQAIAQYEWLATQRPDNALVLNNLAFLYDWKHDSRAMPTAEKAIRLAPTSGTVADTLGWIMVNRGDSAGALKYLSRASGSQPGDAAIQYHYAFALSKTGNAARARDILQGLLKTNIHSNTRSDAEHLLATLPPAR